MPTIIDEMPSINRFLDFYGVNIVPHDLAGTRSRGRYLKSGGALPQSRRDAPQVEAVQAAVLVIASSADPHQTHALESLRGAWNMSAAIEVPRDVGADGYVLRSPPVPTNALKQAMPFGHTIVSLISEYADNSKLESDLVLRVEVWQNEHFAAIHYPDRSVYFSPLVTPPTDGNRTINMTVIPWGALKVLGGFVARSRSIAATMGVQIETASTYQALEPVPPVPPQPVEDFPQSELASSNASAENETAASPARDTAALDQLVHAPLPWNSADHTHTRLGLSMPKSWAGRSHPSVKGNRQYEHAKPPAFVRPAA